MAIKNKAYSKIDLAMAYGVSTHIFSQWIEEIKEEIGWREKGKQQFPPKIVERVFEFLGEPPK